MRLKAPVLFLVAVTGLSQGPNLYDRLLTADDAARLKAAQEARHLAAGAQRELVSRLVQALSGDSSYYASLALGEFGEVAVDPLIQALRNPDQEVRYRASEALGRIRPPAVAPLVETLGESSPRVRCAAAHALELLGESATTAGPALVPLLQTDSKEQARCVIKALGSIGSFEALSALRSELKVAPLQVEALNALAQMGHRAAEATPDVLRILESGPSRRDFAVRTLGAIALPSQTVLDALSGVLADPNRTTRENALQALGKLGPAAAPAIPRIRPFLKAGDAFARHAAAEALGSIGPAAANAVPDLIALWRDPDEFVRRTTGDAVGQIGPGGIPALVSALRDPNPEIRASAAWQLGEFEAATAVAPLGAALRDKEVAVREAARRALAKIASPQAQEALAKAPPEPASAPPFLTLSQIESPLPPTGGQRTPFVLAVKKELAGPHGISFLATVHQSDQEGDILRIWKRDGQRYTLAYKAEEPGGFGEAAYQEPERFRLAGEFFVHLEVLFSGTGAMHQDTILWIAPDGSLHEVKFVRAPEGYQGLGKDELIRKGESNTFEDDNVTFSFGIWLPRDPNCCPSGGEVTGHYKLSGQKRFEEATKQWSADYRIAPADFKRGPSE